MDFTGTDNGETIPGTAGDDRIYAGGGNDTVTAAGGDDEVYGGDGDDSLETERTPALDEHLKGLSAVANYVDRTYSLFKVASARRPDALLQRKRTGRADAAE